MSENGIVEKEPKGEMHVGYGQDSVPHKVLDFLKSSDSYISGATIQRVFKCLSPSTVIAAARKIAIREEEGKISYKKKLGKSESGRPIWGWKWIPKEIEQTSWAGHPNLRGEK